MGTTSARHFRRRDVFLGTRSLQGPRAPGHIALCMQPAPPALCETGRPTFPMFLTLSRGLDFRTAASFGPPSPSPCRVRSDLPSAPLSAARQALCQTLAADRPASNSGPQRRCIPVLKRLRLQYSRARNTWRLTSNKAHLSVATQAGCRAPMKGRPGGDLNIVAFTTGNAAPQPPPALRASGLVGETSRARDRGVVLTRMISPFRWPHLTRRLARVIGHCACAPAGEIKCVRASA
jgi:hypothetical protein